VENEDPLKLAEFQALLNVLCLYGVGRNSEIFLNELRSSKRNEKYLQREQFKTSGLKVRNFL